MMDRILTEDLSIAPSRVWPRLIARHQAVTDYLGIEGPTTADADRTAERTGLSRRMAYRLIEERKRRLAGHSARSPIAGRGRSIEPDQQAVIAEAITRCGPGAGPHDVYMEVQRIGAQWGISAPSEYAVTRRVRNHPKQFSINERLHDSFDWLLDSCQLDFGLIRGRPEPAHLLALIDARTGQIPAHALSASKPDALTIANLVLPRVPQLIRFAHQPSTLAVTKLLWRDVEGLERLLLSNDVSARECPPKTIRSAEALLLIFGDRIGNISLRARPRRSGTFASLPLIEDTAARSVVDLLVTNRNSELDADRSNMLLPPFRSGRNLLHHRREDRFDLLGDPLKTA